MNRALLQSTAFVRAAKKIAKKTLMQPQTSKLLSKCWAKMPSIHVFALISYRVS